MPAFYCGVYGHKPTTGIINTRGCSLRTGREPSTMVVAGPMTRYATDLLPLMQVLVGPEKCTSLRFDEPVDVRKLRYFYITESGDIKCSAVQPSLQKAMDRVVQHFGEIAPAGVRKVTLSGTDRTTNMWRYWMTQGLSFFLSITINPGAIIPSYAVRCHLLGLEPLAVRRHNAQCLFIGGLLNGGPSTHRLCCSALAFCALSRPLRTRNILRIPQLRYRSAGRSDPIGVV